MNGEPRAGRCVIFGSGETAGAPYAPLPNDYLIAADGGYEAIRARGLSPELVVGDFDSLGYRPEGDNVIALPCEKDDPDLILAIQLGLDRGYREFQLYGAAGSRLDHTFANLLALRYLADHGANGRIVTPNSELFILRSGRASFGADERGKISIFSLSERSCGVTLTGLKYRLTDRTLESSEWIGLSNEFIGEPASIEVRDGTLLVVKNAEWVQ